MKASTTTFLCIQNFWVCYFFGYAIQALPRQEQRCNHLMGAQQVQEIQPTLFGSFKTKAPVYPILHPEAFLVRRRWIDWTSHEHRGPLIFYATGALILFKPTGGATIFPQTGPRQLYTRMRMWMRMRMRIRIRMSKYRKFSPGGRGRLDGLGVVYPPLPFSFSPFAPSFLFFCLYLLIPPLLASYFPKLR